MSQNVPVLTESRALHGEGETGTGASRLKSGVFFFVGHSVAFKMLLGSLVVDLRRGNAIWWSAC